MRMAYSKCTNRRNLGTRIWLNNFCHNGSMFLMSPWWSGSTSGLLDLWVSDVSRIPLEMIGIPFVELSPPFCGEHRSWRARTGQLNSLRRNGKSWGRLLASFYECVSQYFQLVSVLCLTVAFLSKGITALLGFGVYAAALIKKRKYWTRGLPGDATDQYFSDKDVTYVNML